MKNSLLVLTLFSFKALFCSSNLPIEKINLSSTFENTLKIKNHFSVFTDTVYTRDTIFECPKKCSYTLIDSMIFDAKKVFDKSFKTSINLNYKIEMIGSYGVANGTPEIDALFQFKSGGSNLNPPKFIKSNFLKWNNSDSFQNKAQNRTYNSNHSYNWLFTAKDTTQRFTFSDNPYSDNSGSIKIKLYLEKCSTYSKLDTIYIRDTVVIKTPSLCADKSQTCESCISADSAMIGCWTFNGNAQDRLKRHKDGIVRGAKLTTDRFGNLDAAYLFDGKSYIEIPDSFEATRNFTISCWVKPDFNYIDPRFGSWSGILSDGSSREIGGFDMFIGIKHDKLIHRADKPISKDYTDYQYSYKFDTTWYNIVWVCGDSGQQVYINGRLIGSTKDRGGNQGYHTKYALFGAWIDQASQKCSDLDTSCKPHNNFSGKIDDVKMWNVLLDSNQIKNVFKCTVNMTTYKDTVRVTIYDTISVQDTLIIYVNLTGTKPLKNNIIKVFPNPAKDELFINFGNYPSMEGYRINIFDASGKSFYDSAVNKQIENIDVKKWSGKGIYFLSIYDSNNNLIETRKIILQ